MSQMPLSMIASFLLILTPDVKNFCSAAKQNQAQVCSIKHLERDPVVVVVVVLFNQFI